MTSLLANHNVMQIDKIGTKSISSLRPVAVVITDDSSIGRETGLVRPVWVETSDIF